MSTQKSELKVDWDYFEGLESSFEELCNELYTTLKKYNRIMKEITTEAVSEGETSQALAEFSSIAEELQPLFRNAGSCLKAQLKGFLIDIDRADKYIY